MTAWIIDSKRKLTVLVLALSIWAAAPRVSGGAVPATGTASQPTRVAILRDNVSGLELLLVDGLSAAMRTAGLAVRTITCDALADASVFNRRSVDALVLTHSPSFPAVATKNLMRFVDAGGHLVLMGGHAFRNPVWKVGGRWVSQAQIDETLSSVPAAKIFFDFQDGVSRWQRSSFKPSRRTRLTTDQGKTARCMRIDVKQLQDGWDTHAADLPSRFEAGTNALCFWAKATKNTPQIAVELDEQDGSRWIAVVDVTPEWKRHVLTTSRFTFWQDGSPTDRSGAGDGLKLIQARRVSFGLAFGLTSQAQGDHTLWIDEVGSAKVDLPAGADASATLDLNVFSDYEPHQLGDIVRVVTAPGQDVLKAKLSIEGRFAGTSAVGFALPARSTFVPVLSALDKYGRDRGWAGGLLIHYDGKHAGSNWLVFGIRSPEFYKAPAFGATLAALIKTITHNDLAKLAKAADTESRSARLKLTTPAPKGFLRLSEDGKHILYPDGRRFFMTGCNYLGSFDRKCYIGGDLFDVRLMEDDFRKCRDAGINILRFWLNGLQNDPSKVRSVKELARRYGVYLLLHLGPGGATSDKIVAGIMPAVRAFKDEPMVLGYDLINEPYLGTVGSIRHNGKKLPILALNAYETFDGQFSKKWVDGCVKRKPAWPQMHKWLDDDDARNLYAAYSLWNRYKARFKIGSYSTFPGITDRLPVNAKWQRFIEAVDETFATWIQFQVDAIRAEDSRHLITVGYNTVLSCLPANRQLDFVSQHVYELPSSYANVMRNVTTLDRLARVWPDQPITFGEFGYSNGVRVSSGFLDLHTSSVGEMIHYLYALARGYDGCMKWSLTDWPIAVMRHNAPWIQGDSKRVYESRFGLYSYDGTTRGRPKPIAHALRFLRDVIDKAGPGGELHVKRGKTAIGAVYVYRAKNALFVGDVAYESPELEFRAARPTNMMLTWDDATLRILSTCDAMVKVDPAGFVRSISAGRAKVAGKCGPRKVVGKHLWLRLLAGETIILR